MRRHVSIPKLRHMLSHLGTEEMLKLHRQDMYKSGDFSLLFCLKKACQGHLCYAQTGVLPSRPKRELEGAPPFM